MHEMSIAQNILEIVESALRENPGSRLKKVVVKAGELAAVVPESLQFCYQALTAGTPLESSELRIEVIPVRARCESCGREFRIESFFFVCPHCESAQVKVLSGQELQVSELEVE